MLGTLFGAILTGIGIAGERYEMNYSKHEGCCNNGRGRYDYSEFAAVRKAKALNNLMAARENGTISEEQFSKRYSEIQNGKF